MARFQFLESRQNRRNETHITSCQYENRVLSNSDFPAKNSSISTLLKINFSSYTS